MMTISLRSATCLGMASANASASAPRSPPQKSTCWYAAGSFSRVGAKDAAVLAREFAPYFSSDDLMNLPHYHVYIRMVIDGKPAKPFSARVLDVDLEPAEAVA